MSTPAIIWIVLAIMTLAYKATAHGELKPVSVTSYLVLDLPLMVGLLYWGGFFS
tara:strand:- start:727 stop:888 length:162 start_codon:yes stop_codon:yes gene_type:complete